MFSDRYVGVLHVRAGYVGTVCHSDSTPTFDRYKRFCCRFVNEKTFGTCLGNISHRVHNFLFFRGTKSNESDTDHHSTSHYSTQEIGSEVVGIRFDSGYSIRNRHHSNFLNPVFPSNADYNSFDGTTFVHYAN